MGCIDAYQGPPDVIVTDAGTSFRSSEIHGPAKGMTIELRRILIEANCAIGKVGRYYAVLRWACGICTREDPSASRGTAFQAAVYAFNGTAGPKRPRAYAARPWSMPSTG